MDTENSTKNEEVIVVEEQKESIDMIDRANQAAARLEEANKKLE